MGRRRIHIARITNEKRRRATLSKRRKGLLKKGMELSILCDCEVAVFVMTKDETHAYTTNGDALETIQRALSRNPQVTHNGLYEQLYLAGEDEDSGDEVEADEEEAPEPAGGALTSKPPSRGKRKRDQIAESPAPVADTNPAKRRAPATTSSSTPSGSIGLPIGPAPAFPSSAPPSHSINSRAATSSRPNTRATASSAPSSSMPPTTSNTNQSTPTAAPGDTNALLQQMLVLSQLLQQQTPGSHHSGDASSTVASVSASLLGTLKQSVEGLASSKQLPQSTPVATPSSVGLDHSSVAGGHSPLMPTNDLSPSLAAMSPNFPFGALTPPTIPSALTPPSMEGHLLDVNFATVSPARDIPSFGDLHGRLNVDGQELRSEASLDDKSLDIAGRRGSVPLGLGLRVSVPQAPRVFNIPPHLMSSTAPPTAGPIGTHNSAALAGTGSTGPNNGLSSSGSLKGTSPPSSAEANKFMAPPLSSMQPPAFPFAGTTNANGEWAPLQSPLVNPSFGMYSPFLYSPRI